MKGLFVLLLTLLFISSSSSQDMRIQISTDSTPVKGVSYVNYDSIEGFRMAYVSDNLCTGCYKDRFQPFRKFSIPKGSSYIYYNKLISDSLNRYWYLYFINGKMELVFIDSTGWRRIDLSLSEKEYQLVRQKNGFITLIYSKEYDLVGDEGFRAINIIDSSYSKIYIISDYVIQPSMGTSDGTSKPCEVTTLYDSLFIAGSYEFKNGFLGSPYQCVSYCHNFKYKKQLILERDSYYPGYTNTVNNKIIALGNTDNYAFIVTVTILYTSSSNIVSYNMYKVDTIIRNKWSSILPSFNLDEFSNKPLSRNGNILALVYLDNNQYNLKVLKDTTWYKTKIINEDTLVTNKSETRVFVEKDSIVWIAYTGIKGAQRHLFLQKVIPNWEIDDEATGVEEKIKSQKNSEYKLYQNYPNPFNPATNIIFTIGADGRSTISGEVLVQLKVYDVLGREVAVLVNELRKPGRYQIPFSGISLPSGIYFYRLRAGEHTDIKRMLLIK
jgi:hypothetical protein